MKIHTDDFKIEIKSLGRMQDVRITYSLNNQINIIDGENINSITPNYSASLLKSVMKCLDIDSNIQLPKGTKIKFEYGLLVNGTYEYLNYGNYIVYSSEKQEDTLSYSIKCYDKLLYSMKDYEGLNITYPCTIKQYLAALCNRIGLEFKDSSFANQNRQVTNDLFKGQGYTYRDVLDQIAEVAGGVICLTIDDKVEVRYINETNDTIDEEYINDTNVKFGEKYGPVNSIVLARAGDSDKIYKKDDTSIAKNGLCELKISENQFMNFNDRVDYLQELSDKLLGIEYYLNDFVSTGIMYYDLFDMYNVKIGNNTYNCLMLNDEQLITQGLEENIYTDRPDKSETDYSKADKTDRKINQTNFIVDKQNQKIEGIISQIGDRTEKTTTITADIDGINSKVSHIEETTNTIEGNKTISLGNAVAGELIELHIYGNNDVFSSLKIGDDVVLSDDLYLLGDSIIVVKDSKGNSKEYELGITEPLKQKDGVYDEYVLKDGKAQIIRRINENGTIKAKETIEDLGQFSIELFDGTNTLSIKNYTARLKAKFAIQNDMTNIYASKVEMNSAIEQSAEKVDININKKLESYSKTTEMNALIDVKAEEISSQVKEKVGKAEVGTYIEQNKEAVKLAWNQISEFIQMMIINNNASFAILDNNKKVLMALDKSGQHFYKSDGKTIFGDMGVQKEDNDQYIAFSVLSDYNQKTSNGMAWGIKTKSDNKFHPIFYIKNFEMAEKDSDASYGELVLSFCNILLNGISTGIISGNIKMYGDDANNAIQFINTDTGDILLSISTKDLETEYEKIKILNNISFFKNVGGTNSFKIGNGTNNYVLFEDDGSIGCYGGTVRLGLTGKEVSFDLYVKSLASIYGDLNVNGNVYANNISSDRRIKDNIKDCDVKALDIINKFQHKQFDKKDDGKHYNIGYIAQDMEKIDPNFVIKREKTENLEDRYYINELPIIATLSKAVQELSQQVEKLQDEIKILKEEKFNEINKLDK